ncbi:MAG: FAD-dependent oxidoreductase [Candidatus Omnitrophica bacterium]|nr:FAD-dependent oxidoreductase [Candidatus Omnitrophota bacterium]MDD5488761.1 FAD-dependent oxidoreductase [Candidatus Omnitrophota bacterium]
MKDIVVLGGGLAGCTLGYLLKRAGYNVTIVEKNEYMGGLCHTGDFHGVNYEFGPHVLYAEPGSEEEIFFRKFLDNREHRFFPLLSIDGSLDDLADFPVTAANVLKLPLEDREKAVEELYHVNLEKPSHENFQKYVISRVGATMYRYFFENYNKKQWGIDPVDMDIEWARFRNLALREKGKGMFGDKWQGHPGSYKPLFDKLLDGINVVKAYVSSAEWAPKRIKSVDTDKGKIEGDFFFSTVPIERLFGASCLLPYRGILKWYFLLGGGVSMSSYVTTFPNNYSFTRIVDYRSQSLQEHGDSLVSFAFPFNAHKQEELSPDALKTEAEDFLSSRMGADIKDSFSVRKDHVYPVATFQNIRLFKGLLSKLSECDNVMSVGRLGLYSYISMDTCVGQCLKIMDEFEKWPELGIVERMEHYDSIRQKLS